MKEKNLRPNPVRRIILATLMALTLLTVAIICPLAYAKQKASAPGRLHLVDLSDVHLFDNSLMADTEDWRREETDDLKKNYCNIAIIDKTLESVREQKPEVILINGDLTKNGELISERTLAAKLNALKKDLPETHIYVINGNHDINSSGATNYNTPSGKAEPAEQTSPAQFKRLYAVTYDDPTIIARYTPKKGKQAGQLSYVARPKPGYTVIAIDDGRYSSDNTDNHKNEAMGGGKITDDLADWVVAQAKAARKRGDTVIGFEHHGIIHHNPIEGSNLNKDYNKIGPRFANAGLSYLFTGHMHCDDVAKLRTTSGNDLWDIETGTPLTYPSAYRVVDFSRRQEKDGSITETLDGKLIDHLGPVTYRNPVTGKTETITDITEYNRERCVTPEWVLSKLENPLRKECEKLGIPYSKALNNAIDQVCGDLFAIPIDDSGDHNLIQWADYLMQGWFAGTDNGKDEPAWFQQGTQRLHDGRMLRDAVAVLVKDTAKLPDATAEQVLRLIFPNDVMKDLNINFTTDINEKIMNAKLSTVQVLAPDVSKKLNDTLVYYLDQFRVDPNDQDDRDFYIVTYGHSGVRNDGIPLVKTEEPSNALIKFLNKIL